MSASIRSAGRKDAFTMADLPVQLPAEPRDAAGRRARFFNSGNAFNLKLPPVPAGIFAAEAAIALAPGCGTGLVACDQSGAMGMATPATTPLMLARYVTVAAEDSLELDLRATGSIWYVIEGRGETRVGSETIAWAAGDVLLLPGETIRLKAVGERAVLWVVTNEPQLAFDGSRPPSPDGAPVKPVHYPASEIARQLALIYEAAPDDTTSGLALIFSSEAHEASRNIMASLTLSLNTLPGGAAQRPHRHNAAAITLVVQGRSSFSLIDGARAEWSEWATLVTPPCAPHSHHNGGSERALFLIVQDGGFHYQARTMGFAFLDA